ncbi:uncharacterized protein [Drosophila kikkawai]|uniref:Uncharacterized protein isoform X1 n=1 Tax=Drosophila kikkawai TaxID=30033 RepID=A0A6P4J6E2_DROKI|nr:uncharacterized protein LOC108080517 isoform X1 [Drosophila kikkawai]
MSQHSNTSIEVWREFFKLYRSMPELWLVRSKPYRNRRLKNESYGQLLTLMRQIESNANIHTLKRKINNFRTSYRRELRKVLRSGHSYVPNLWYFKDLDFLCDLETSDLQDDSMMQKESETEMDLEPDSLAQDNTEEYQPQTSNELGNLERVQLKVENTENMGVGEINEVSSSGLENQHHYNQVLVHHINHIGTDTEDDEIFAGSFEKEEDVLGGMEPGSEGEAEPEQYIDTEADPDHDLESEPIIAVRHRTNLKENNDFHDSREGHDLNKSLRSTTTLRNKRRRNSNASDYDDSRNQQGKRQRVTEELSLDRNRDWDRDRVIDRESDNECELIGKRMAAHFRNMRTDQRLFAERIISEVLVFGRMNRLSFDSQFIPDRK